MASGLLRMSSFSISMAFSFSSMAAGTSAALTYRTSAQAAICREGGEGSAREAA
jgi:hypothetical protein